MSGRETMDTAASQTDALGIYSLCGWLFLFLNANLPPTPPKKTPTKQTQETPKPLGSKWSIWIMKNLFFLPLNYSPFYCQKAELGLFWLHGRHGKLLITCVKYSCHVHTWSLGILSKTCLAIDCCFEESVQQLFLSFPPWNGNCKGNHSYLK